MSLPPALSTRIKKTIHLIIGQGEYLIVIIKIKFKDNLYIYFNLHMFKKHVIKSFISNSFKTLLKIVVK